MASNAWSVGRSLAPLLGLNAFAAYLMTAQGVVTPFLATTWNLSDSEITFLAGVISLGALGTVVLTRLADRSGRRRLLLTSFLAALVLSVASGFAESLASYALLQLLLLAAAGSIQVGASVAVSEQTAESERPVGQSWYGFTAALASGIPFFLAPALAGIAGGWRWMWIAAALMALVGPFLRRALDETRRFERAQAAGPPSGRG